ncbi:unnamed protein product, partial [Ectocarpus sp. 12 AP-2014]
SRLPVERRAPPLVVRVSRRSRLAGQESLRRGWNTGVAPGREVSSHVGTRQRGARSRHQPAFVPDERKRAVKSVERPTGKRCLPGSSSSNNSSRRRLSSSGKS